MKVTPVTKTTAVAVDRQPRPAELIKKQKPGVPKTDSRFDALLKAELLKGRKS